MHGSADNSESGAFHRLGGVVVRWPWLVIGFWVVLAAALPSMFPSLTELSQKTPPAMLPADAPGSVAARQMSEAFHESGSDNMLLVVLSDDNGLDDADEAVYHRLVDTLRADTASVVTMQDFVSTPPLRQVMTSQDGKAWLLPVSLTGELGSPQSYTATANVSRIVKDAVNGSGITAHVTGPAATLADIAEVGEKDRVHIELATVGMLLTILIIIYRNPLTMVLPLLTIGVSLATAQGVVAGLGSLGLAISSQTIVFLTAMLAGTGTDYAVFLISRYHDFLRLGHSSEDSVKNALNSIGPVIVASAATVAVTFLGMVFTKLTIFSSVGVALAVAIAIGCLAAMTFLPAVLTLAGRRGWVSPRRSLTNTLWRRSGVRIVRNPRRNLVISLVLLVILASCAGLASYNYDDRKALPGSVESLQGYDAIAAHFPVNSSLPQYLLVESPHDLRGPKELADLEQMAQRISQLPNIEAVRGITRPTGESLEQARLSFQAGEVGSKLDDASSLVSERGGDMDKLASGATQIADVLGGVRGQLGQAAVTVGGLIDALSSMQKQFGGEKALNQFDSAAKLVLSMRSLGDSIGVTLDDAADSVQRARPVLTALNASPICDADPSCRDSRGQLQRLVDAGDNGTLAGIAQLARQLKATEGNQTLGATTDNLRGAFDTATKALRSAGMDDPSAMRRQMATLQQHADTLADASRQVAEGVNLLVNETKKMGGGLGDASAFLLAMKNEARTPSMSGFYVPPQFLATDDFKKAAALFFSPDGHTVRYMIQTKLNPFGTDAMDQIDAILDVAHHAQPNTTLADAKVSMTGYSVSLRDTREYYNEDIRFIILVTVAVVFLILVVLLRALVAPLYLIASVVISYLSALGIGVLLFQVGLGQELHWSVPGLTFIILVAVGADYNLLLISRIREESPHGLRTAVIRTVGATGGVITAAGLIFTASMFGMLFASISTLVQAGFIIGVGILLDTFLVRTTTVPAIAVLVGRFNWWPSRWQPETKRPEKAVENSEPDQELATAAD
ncbi:RND family transporter [Mycobacterium sp. TNTM28]|uniref:RND family transporter n=1 Tax=[Mycobacterium] fortunisiensis TaxID=2600579 RepID=A0ABS6KN00_9MYCO|nr:RND family transporter [[Mycobacterium] fortunisiensis]